MNDKGTLVCMMRATQQPRNRHHDLWKTCSHNGGITWTNPEPSGIWGYPPHLLRLKDGRILCTYGHRREPYSIKACISDDGTDWDVKNEFVVCAAVTAPSIVPNYWHIGYPTTIQLNDGKLLTVYHEWSGQNPRVQYITSVRYEI
jgi:hypothetical protein